MASRRRTPPTVTPPSTPRMATPRASDIVTSHPLTAGPNHDPVTIVHLAAELAPFARTGGLGEAVSSLAHYQARSGITSIIIMPLYKQVLDVANDLEPVGPAFPVQVGPRHEEGRLYESRALINNPREGKPRILFIHNADYFGREQIYGDSTGASHSSAWQR
jgi:glycogen synthase